MLVYYKIKNFDYTTTISDNLIIQTLSMYIVDSVRANNLCSIISKTLILCKPYIVYQHQTPIRLINNL